MPMIINCSYELIPVYQYRVSLGTKFLIVGPGNNIRTGLMPPYVVSPPVRILHYLSMHVGCQQSFSNINVCSCQHRCPHLSQICCCVFVVRGGNQWRWKERPSIWDTFTHEGELNLYTSYIYMIELFIRWTFCIYSYVGIHSIVTSCLMFNSCRRCTS